MIYEYRCLACRHEFDVVKSYKDMEISENCPQCGDFAERAFVPQRIHLHNTKVEHAEYNPALGQVVKNRNHRAEIAKRKGLIEIGNEKPDTLAKMAEKTQEERRRKRWEEV